ncbi:MAG: sigma-54 dependent transcriptional regulator, partial [Pseudomonadota bacterium]
MKKADSKTILVVDDQQDVREALRLMLTSEGFAVALASTPEQALNKMADEVPSLVLFDMNYRRDTTSGQEGLDLLHAMQTKYADDAIPLVAMTAWGSIDLAVNAVKQGASDFIEKPWENQRLLSLIRTQLERSKATRSAAKLGALNRIQRENSQAKNFVAESKAMQKLLEMAHQIAQSDASILITGDNGSGKSLIAEQIHRWSPLVDAVFVSVNMGSIPESLFEAEMFGHARGAFTDAIEARAGRFELADEGTLFLDEVGNLPMPQQAKLLRVLETGEFERVGETRTRKVRVRVIAATNADLPAMVERGEFRRDLYFRLNTIELNIPSLAERRD